MHPPDCPEWDYSKFANHSTQIPIAVAAIMAALRKKEIDVLGTVADTRGIHQRLFSGLTQPDCEYFVGHYRGEDYKCLKFYSVGIEGNANVGAPPQQVLSHMVEFQKFILEQIKIINSCNNWPESQLGRGTKLSYLVCIVCRMFDIFLRIHPYANGNGHTGRFILISLLGMFGFWIRGWPIDPRPEDPPYSQLIQAYQMGNKAPLEEFIARNI